MRILQICSAASVGGGERHLADLSNSLSSGGNEVFVALRPGSPVRKELTEIPDENFEFVSMRGAADVRSAVKIGRFAERIGADIIHAHVARDYPIAAAASRLSGIRYVITRHVLFPLKILHKIVLSGVSGVIAPSHSVYVSLFQSGIFQSKLIGMIEHGIDSRRFTSVTREQHHRFTVGIIGTLTKNKGQDLFLRAARLAVDADPSLRFVIEGQDASRKGGFRKKLVQMIAELGLEEFVRFTGPSEDIAKFLSTLDILVSASRSESFGLVIVEAMMSRLPVIATSSEGAMEIIDNGETGILVPIGDHAEMARAILDLAADRSLRDRLASNGQTEAVKKYSLERMVNETEGFYRDVLAARRT